MYKIYFFVFIMLAFSFCKRYEKKIVTQSGTIIETKRNSGEITTIDSISIAVNYVPTDSMLKQTINKKQNSKAEIDKERENFSRYAYFVLNLSYKYREITDYLMQDKAAYRQMLNKLSFDMSGFVKIITSNNDTVGLYDQAYVRTYGLTGKNTVMLVFERDKLKSAKWYDLVFPEIDAEPVKIRFTNKD